MERRRCPMSYFTHTHLHKHRRPGTFGTVPLRHHHQHSHSDSQPTANTANHKHAHDAAYDTTPVRRAQVYHYCLGNPFHGEPDEWCPCICCQGLDEHGKPLKGAAGDRARNVIRHSWHDKGEFPETCVKCAIVVKE